MLLFFFHHSHPFFHVPLIPSHNEAGTRTRTCRVFFKDPKRSCAFESLTPSPSRTTHTGPDSARSAASETTSRGLGSSSHTAFTHSDSPLALFLLFVQKQFRARGVGSVDASRSRYLRPNLLFSFLLHFIFFLYDFFFAELNMFVFLCCHGKYPVLV